jgi:hypothetical protein
VDTAAADTRADRISSHALFGLANPSSSLLGQQDSKLRDGAATAKAEKVRVADFLYFAQRRRATLLTTTTMTQA